MLGPAGRLVNPENVEEFAATISELLAKPEYCASLGRAGYERCREMFDWGVVSKTWMTLLEGLGSGEISAGPPTSPAQLSTGQPF